MSKPQLQDSYDAVSDADIEAFEAMMGFRLPPQYRSFLLRSNGGDFPASAGFMTDPHEDDYVSVTKFYGLLAGDSNDLLAANRNADFVPRDLLAIGSDEFGDQICLAVAGPDVGTVWFCVHDYSPGYDWPPQNGSQVAKSFVEFFDNIHYDPDGEEEWTETIPAFIAAELGDSESLNSLLDQGFAVESRNEIGETLLICAARSRQSQIVDTLVQRGASVAARDENENTALLAACRHHSFDSAKILLAAGADIEA